MAFGPAKVTVNQPTMSLVRKMLSKLWPKNACEGGQRVHLAIFGKHPGWDDHIDDLGLDSPRLVEVKRLLYTQGIGGNVDSGRWDRLDPSHRLDAFAHVFVWRFGRDMVAGRIWSSQDGKGRSHYPMIACSHGCNLPPAWTLDHALPALEELQAACAATRLAQDVRSALQSARDRLRGLAAEVAEPPWPAAANGPAEVAALLDQPGMGPHGEGFHRILYQLFQLFPSFAKRSPWVSGAQRSAGVRVPAGGSTPQQVMRRWLALLETLVPPEVPVLLVFPLKAGWVDLTLGPEPSVLDVFSMKAGAAAIPLTTDIPYNLDAGFLAQARRITEGLRQGRPTATPAG